MGWLLILILNSGIARSPPGPMNSTKPVAARMATTWKIGSRPSATFRNRPA